MNSQVEPALLIDNAGLVGPIDAGLHRDIRVPRHWGSTALLLCLLALSAALYLSLTLVSENYSRKRQAIAQIDAIADNIHQNVTDDFAQLQSITRNLVQQLNQQPPSAASYEALILQTQQQYPKLFGVGLAFTPEAAMKLGIEGPQPRFAPYAIKTQDHIVHIDQSYDYTQIYPDEQPNTLWYHQTLAQGEQWMEPYYGTASESLLAEFTSPFTLTGEQAASGVAFVNYSLSNLHRTINSADLGNSGYSFVITERGNIIAFPLTEYLSHNIHDPRYDDDPLILAIRDTFLAEDTVSIALEQQYAYGWITYRDLLSSGWKVGFVYIPDHTVEDIKLHQQLLAGSAFLVLLALTALCIWWISRRSRQCLYQWLLSGCFSFAALAILAWSWHLLMFTPLPVESQGNKLYNLDELTWGDTVTDKAGGHETTPSEALTLMKVGIFVQSLRFDGANNVVTTGYFWHDSDCLSTLDKPAILFPEAEEIITERYNCTDGKALWYFTANLRQPFDYRRYPFDRVNIWLRLWPAAFDYNIRLVPDTRAYDSLLPSTLPGLEETLILEGWRMVSSFFSYRDHHYATRFHQTLTDDAGSRPELYFNIEATRYVLGPFITHMIPLLTVAFLIFAISLIWSKTNEEIGLFGFSASNVLQYNAALLFILIVSHVHLREQLTTQGIIYLEHFYFLMYLTILIYSSVVIIFCRRAIAGKNLFSHHLMRLCYWPWLTTASLASVFTTF